MGKWGDRVKIESITFQEKEIKAAAHIAPSTQNNIDVELSAKAGAGEWNELKNKPFEQIGSGLKVEGGVLAVDAANKAERDNSKPITSAAVYVELGNVEVLLRSI